MGLRSPLWFETRSNFCCLTRSGEMDCIVSSLLHSIVAIFFPYDEDEVESSGIDAIYIVLAFFALGIWIVFKRYETIQSRAIDFEWSAPEVSHVLVEYSA